MQPAYLGFSADACQRAQELWPDAPWASGGVAAWKPKGRLCAWLPAGLGCIVLDLRQTRVGAAIPLVQALTRLPCCQAVGSSEKVRPIFDR